MSTGMTSAVIDELAVDATVGCWVMADLAIEVLFDWRAT